MTLRGGLRYLRAVLLWALAIVIIGIAVIVALGRLAAPHADRLRPWVEDYLSQRLRQPVAIERIEARWPRLLPRVTLHDMTFGGNGEPAVHIDRLYLESELRGLLTPGRNPVRLVLAGITGDLARQDGGRWRFGLFGTTGLRLDPRVLNLGDISLVDSEVVFRPYDEGGVIWRVEQARIQRRGTQVSVIAEAMPEGRMTGRAELRAHLTMAGDDVGAVRAWTELDRIALTSAWPSSRVSEAAPGDRVSGQVWWSWQGGSALSARGRLSWVHENADTLFPRRESRSARFRLDGVPGDWQLEAGFEGAAGSAGRVSMGRRGDRWALRVDELDLAVLQPWIRPWLERERIWPAISGIIPELELSGTGLTLVSARGRVEDFGIVPGARTPGVAGLDIRVGNRHDRLELGLEAQAPRMVWPGMLRAPVGFESLRGRLLVAPDLVELEDVIVEHAVGTIRVDGFVGRSGQSPFLDLAVDFPELAIDDPGALYPVGIMPPEAVAWLDRAFPAGGRVGGRMQIFGQPSHWPWHAGEGVFQARAGVRDLRLDFHERWPAADIPRARLAFDGLGMTASARRGGLAGLEVASAAARIDNLKRPRLELEFRDDDLSADGLRSLLLQAPLNLEGMKRLEFDGRLGARVGLNVPLTRGGGAWVLSGQGELDGVTVRDAGGKFILEAVTGSLEVNRERLAATALNAWIGNRPVVLGIHAGREPGVQVDLSGMLGLREVLPLTWRRRLPDSLLDELSRGVAEWRMAYRKPPGDSAWTVTLESGLAGLGLNLPEPLYKPPGTVWPLVLRVEGRDEKADSAHLEVAGIISVAGDAAPARVGIRFGSGPVPVPRNEDFRVEGRTGTLDSTGWGRLAARLSAADILPAGGGNLDGTLGLDVAQLRVGDRDVPDVRVSLGRADRHWRLDVDGEHARGEIRLPAADAAGAIVVGDFQRLHLGPAGEAGGGESGGTVNPARVPALHLLIEDLRAGDLELGRLRLESYPDDDGLEVELLQTDHPGLQISGRGRWLNTSQRGRSEFDLRLSTPDLGGVLTSLGFGATVEAASAVVDLEGNWPGAPTDFALAEVVGRLELDIRNGRFPEASPGAGRMLGLISLASLPRRLRLDFSDVFGEGFGFDRIHGAFELEAGRARTADLRVAAPAADMRITGETDLVEQVYNQEIGVRPGLGSTLPVLGALAGGPGGAAAGLALQGLLQRPLSELAEVRYRVTGPWRDPQITLIDATARPPAATEGDSAPDGGEGDLPGKPAPAP